MLAAGLVWIGPPPSVIAALGNKVIARQIASEVGAPLAPGTESPVSGTAEVEVFAAEHGLPLLIKAAEIPDAFAAATREATAAFGRGECYVERYLMPPEGGQEMSSLINPGG